MNNQPLVSVIIPTYNRAHLIGETLDSVLAQTYQNWECIIVDDGSKDNTDEVVGKYVKKDSRFKYYHRPEEHLPGGNGARNYGIIKSEGDFINFLDSDDYLHAFTLEDKFKFAKDNTDVIISRHTATSKELSRAKIIVEEILNDKYDEGFIMSQPNILMGDPLISKDFLGGLKFSESQKRGQDHLFFISLFENTGNFIKIDGVHYLYNKTPNSITRRTAAGDKTMFTQQLKIGETMIEKYKHNPEIVHAYKRKSRQMYKSLIKKGKHNRVLENFSHFKNSYKLNTIEFMFWYVYNSITKSGFDKMKRKAL
jgi:glycosyltransferase involved in cell wall biosynthesis